MGSSNSSLTAPDNTKEKILPYPPKQAGHQELNHEPTKLANEWSRQIYFDAEADSENGNNYCIEAHHLWDKLSCLIDIEDEIQEISVYSHKLYHWQLTHKFLHHAFVLIKSSSCHYWSIEKNDEGLTIQRSNKIEFVHLKYRREMRKGPVTLKSRAPCGEGDLNWKCTMKHLIQFLQDGDELNNDYKWYKTSSNCQGFAQRVFQVLSDGPDNNSNG